MTQNFAALANTYFEFLAARFPVMCASDEFYFMPRAAAAAGFYDRLDSFAEGEMEEAVAELRTFGKRFDAVPSPESDPDSAADLLLLKSSLAGTLIGLADKKPWRNDPLLYLKVAFIGLDHALTKPAASRKEAIERTRARLSGIPRLFRQGAENIEQVPESRYGPSLAMAAGCGEYLETLAGTLPGEERGRLEAGLAEAAAALAEFSRFMGALRPVPDAQLPAPDIQAVLENVFLCSRTPAEIFEIGVEEWNEHLLELGRLALRIAPGSTWQEIYHGYLPAEAAGMDTIALYEREIENLRSFFVARGFADASHGLPEVVETPAYLRAVRGWASFSAAFTRDAGEKDYFYITTRPDGQGSEESAQLLSKRLHREYKFLSAHEAFPGHGLLDGTRRRLTNPVRSQIESPLFYEGWAFYVETLLPELGYAVSPVERIVERRRRLWRAARCQIDAGLSTGRLDRAGAVALLTAAGFAREEAVRQVDRFRLNPGYQLCYTLGKYEIMKLRELYSGRLGLDRFHRLLLEGGELPFPLIAKRLERVAVEKKD